MIPKRIHYCWLSGEPLPELHRRCVESWGRVLPDYELVLWDQQRFEVSSVPFVAEAVEVGAWAFAADYIRLHALAEEGGVYLDSDVEVRRSFDGFLGHRAFSSIEHWPEIPSIGIEGAILGAEAGHPWIRDCLATFEDRRFLDADGRRDETIIGRVLADVAVARYGFRREVEEQELAEGIHLYPPVVLTHDGGEFSAERTHAVHHCVGSWRRPEPWWTIPGRAWRKMRRRWVGR